MSERIFGALPPKKDVREYKAKKSKAAMAVNLPEEFELDMPAIKNQGSTGSCVAHSVSTAIEYFNKLQEGSDVVFSVGYIYGNRRNSTWKGQGMYVDDALKTVAKWGDVPNSMFNYNLEVPDAISKFEEQAFDLAPQALPNRITEFFALNNDEQRKLNLIQNGPIVFSIPWYSDYYVEKGTYILKRASETSEAAGHHAMVIYGWNKDGWKFQNSWGKTFGNKGRAVLPYGTKFGTCYGIKDFVTSKVSAEALEKLRIEIEALNKTLDEKQAKLEEYLEKLTNAEEMLDLSKTERNKLLKDKDALQKEVEDLQKQLDGLMIKNKQLEILNEELLNIKKPFRNLPDWLIKLINSILNLFRKK